MKRWSKRAFSRTVQAAMSGGSLCLGGLCGCAEPDATEAAVGQSQQAILFAGNLTDEGEPDVQVTTPRNDSILCSGFLVGPQLAMTAAHCAPSAWASVGVSYDLSQKDDWDYGEDHLWPLNIETRWYDAEVVGAAYDNDLGQVHFWTRDGRVYRKIDATPLWWAGMISGERTVTYPSGLGASNLLDTAYHEGYFYAYFDDGTISRGTSADDLSDGFGEMTVHDRFGSIDGPEDVMAVEFPVENSDNVTFWYKNGRRGSVTNFGRGEALRDLLPYATHRDMQPTDLRALAMDPRPYSGGPGGETFAVWPRPAASDFAIESPDGQISKGSEVVLHSSQLDVALIRVEDSLPSPNDGFVTLPDEYTGGDFWGLTPICHAYGNTDPEGRNFGAPRQTIVELLEDESTFEALRTWPIDGGAVFHFGDSGGPCFVRGPGDEYELVGVILGATGDNPRVGRLAGAPALRDWYLSNAGSLSLKNSWAELRDETFSSSTTSQLRMVFQNSSPFVLESPKVYYYFTTEGGKTPVLEDYYTPTSEVWLEQIEGDNYRLVYSFEGVSLQPGAVLPDSGGNVVALHYGDGSYWDKSNDPSQPSGSEFEASRSLVVLDGDGSIVGGTPPEPVPPGELECKDISVYVRDSQLSEHNISTPRWYLKNQGNATLSNFKVRYHFTTEGGKTPVLEDHYSPGCALSLVQVGGAEWYAECDFAGASLAPGATQPNPDGIAFSLHYGDWSSWDKSNDASNPGTQSFVPSTQLSIVLEDGSLLCQDVVIH